MKKIFTLTLAAAAAATLSACGSKTDANAKNFGAAVRQYLEQKDPLCLDTTGFPLIPDGFSKKTEEQQMAVLEKIGLVKGEDAEVERENVWHFGRNKKIEKIQVRRYHLTDAGKPFAQEREKMMGGTLTDLCWGKRVLDKVVKWDAPMKLGDWQETHVTYTFKIENLAEWAKNPEVQEAFPSIKKTIEGDKELGLNVHLTSEGWEAGRRGF
ncbi:MAG: hypothetical protein IK051_08910 [Rhodocyclaceae bacterium]|nr:hypothetical protein [Rhodocyclaceae bacterium]